MDTSIVNEEKAVEVAKDCRSLDTSKRVISSDNEYIDGQFKVCGLLMQKYELLREIKEAGSNKSPDKRKSEGSFKAKIHVFNAKIKEEDAIFWQDVEVSLKEGKRFIIEEFAAYHKLDLFEKRILLFFLYLEFCRPAKNVVSKDEILSLFDLDDSLLMRIKNARYLVYYAPLLSGNIIRLENMQFHGFSKTEYALTPFAVTQISRMLNGEAPDWDNDKTSEISKCDSVGYTKQPECTLDNVILKPDIKEKVRFFIESFKDDRLETFGVSETIKNSKGIIFLFYGPPGTGKTMLAEAIAKEVGKAMLLVEYPKIMSRWVGETDKKISAAFKAAWEQKLVLVMDEADSLLYNRSYATQEHDIRFVNEMLQELEKYEGIVILTTNMDNLLDQALERRVSLKVRFELPDEAMREKIWQSHVPSTVKFGEQIDFASLAKRYDFSGGHIKNAALNAMRRISLRNENRIYMEDFIFGADMEKDGMFNSKNEKKIKGFSETY